MKTKLAKTICVLLSCTLICGCSSTTTDYSGIIFDNHHIRKADMGNSLTQVMASESADFVEELTSQSEEIVKEFGTDSGITGLSYSDDNVAGHSAKINYYFYDDKLIMAAVYLSPLYPSDLYNNLTSYYEGVFGRPGESISFSQTKENSAFFWEEGNYRFAVTWYGNNTIAAIAYNPNKVKLL